ncbi:MAG: hypothetical protein NZ924_04065 [Candidatus Bipolaricaulota bacterium]|nr:hypothetical protein [Candidatus Bipolaricaulota bacterium]MDW8152077.1 hypothetical protein [Candidatus Bipolaricaulota bacterium]
MRWLWPWVLALVAIGGSAQGLRFWGSWDMTLELLPSLRIYGSNLYLNCSFAPGWRIESETKIYSGGVFKYQNFYVSGSLGDIRVWGKTYFHAEEVRYQKMWFNAEISLLGGTLRGSFNHWASAKDYTTTDQEMFGAWPCVGLEVVSWEEAWKFMERAVSVTGPVASASMSGGNVFINVGRAFPDPYRFQIFIPASAVPAFEAVFGDDFWVTWNTTKPQICVKGTIKGYRYTTGGPGGGGYSVAEISLTDPAALTLGPCHGVWVTPTCPDALIRWFEARHNYDGKTVCIQGPVVSITGPGTYHGQPNTYRIRIGGGGDVGNRVEVILPYHPGWSTVGTSYYDEVCVCGTVRVIGGVAVILPDDVLRVSGDPCCGVAPIPFVNWQLRYSLAPWTLSADFGDCGTGLTFRRLQLDASGLPLCCGLFLDASFALTKSGFEKLSLTLREVFLCCGLTAKIAATFTPTAKAVEFKPSWQGLSGCFAVYGDVLFADNAWQGLEIWGFLAHCYLPGCGHVRLLTAFDPGKFWIDEEGNIAASRTRPSYSSALFRTGEFEYVNAKFCLPGCCGGEVALNLEGWFGSGTYLFGFRRFKFDLQVPVAASITLFSKAQWDFSKPSPLEWFDVGWSLSF